MNSLMLIIAHRGNLAGPDPTRENHPTSIKRALSLGFDVEVDVWCDGSHFALGHDQPQFDVTIQFLSDARLWIHAKNLQAVQQLRCTPLHWFWHERDTITLTSKRIVWALPGNYCPSAIVVETGKPKPVGRVGGVCTDFAYLWRSEYRSVAQRGHDF
jgi:hypothetical protein